MIKKSIYKLLVCAIILFAVTLATNMPSALYGRAGGGHSFSSGSSSWGGSSSSRSYSSSSYGSSSYSSSSGGSGDPVVGAICTLLFVIFLVASTIYENVTEKIAVYKEKGRYTNRLSPEEDIDDGIKQILKEDPNFSKILFLDFTRLLFTRYLEARGKDTGNRDALEYYLSPPLYTELMDKFGEDSSYDVTRIENVIIGKMNLVKVSESDQWFQIAVNFLINADQYSTSFPKGSTVVASYTVQFTRRKDMLSPGPSTMRALNCPFCGSPLKDEGKGTCASCGKPPKPGYGQWQMFNYTCVSRKMIPIEEHTSNSNEPSDIKGIDIAIPGKSSAAGSNRGLAGNEPDAMFSANMRELYSRDTHFTMEDFKDIVHHVFFKLQAAWSGDDYSKSRSIQTESLYLTNLFWIEQYARKGQKNILAEPDIHSVEFVSVDCDAYYDSIKVAIKASGKDYTIDKTGTVISGSKDNVSIFTEHWTFVRARPSAHTDQQSSTCPNCGGSIHEASTVECEWCGSLLKGSKFNWILAIIEQV